MAKQQRQQAADPTEQYLQGTIVKWMPDKGFGFIVGPDGKEYFFHRSAVRTDLHLLQPATRVQFLPTDGGRGPRAEDVCLTD